MAHEDIAWLTGIFTGSFGINLGIWRLILNDKITSPVLTAGLLNAFLTTGLGLFSYFYLNSTAIAIGTIIISSMFLGFMLYSVKERDKKGIKIGEELLATFHEIDLQISYVLHLKTSGGAQDELYKSIEISLNYVLDEIERYLRLEDIDNTVLSIFYVKSNGKFKILASRNISSSLHSEIESTLRHGKDPIGLSGRVANDHSPICIFDLSDDKDRNAEYWVPLYPYTKPVGAIICYPINRGIGKKENTMAVINISSPKSMSFNCEAVQELLMQFSAKIETLIYCLEIT